MSLARAIPSLASATRACAHCGAGVPPSRTGNFCCQGCESVFALLAERGLNSTYYRLQGKAMEGAHPATAAESSESYAYLDDPEFVREYGVAEGRGMDFYLDGVHCAACVWLTERLPEYVAGVTSLRLNLATGVASVRLGAGGSFSQAARELARFGYRPHPVKQDESLSLRKKENRLHLLQMGVAAAVSGNLMILAVALYAGADGGLAETFRWVSGLIFLPVPLFSARPFYRSAWSALRSGRVSIDIPIVFGILAGTLVSYGGLFFGSEHIYFDSVATLVFLMLSTRYLLKKVHQQAFDSAQMMYFLAPSRTRLEDPTTGEYRESRTDSLKADDLIQVLPGECFPVDGVVEQGRSTVSCALLTGESKPVTVMPGATVNAGTLNQAAPLEVRVIASGAATRLGKILRLMEEGLARKSPVVALIDRVGQAFIIAVLALTVLAFLVGAGVSWHEAINRALAMAIVVCPCTFALATPLAMSIAISRCARSGILVKGADVLERLSQVQDVFFDKTGTLTEGELEVMSWEPLAAHAEAALIELESRSTHPIAKAVQRHFMDRLAEATRGEVAEFRETPGRGVSGRIEGNLYEVRALDPPWPGIDSPIGSISTEVGVYREGILIGRLALGDRLRPDAALAVKRLQASGYRVHLLSGDALSPVQQVAFELDLPKARVVSQASPEDKGKWVQASPRSLMVGDGGNDAIALASAFAGVAVQGGMEVSLKAAGAYSSRPGVLPICELLSVARKTMRVIRRNLVFAILYNLVGIALALTGQITPLVAAILMPLSALTVFLSTVAGTRRLG